jgi:phosphate acetyltransferase
MGHLTFKDLLKKAKKLPPLLTAVVHPVTKEALKGLEEASKQKLIVPILIGPAHKIKVAAKKANVTISQFELIDTEHSHASADQAVAMARAGDVQMLMKGSLHTDEFMQAAVDKNIGLRTERRMSHVFVAEIKTYPKLLYLTDCVLNIKPDLMCKRDILQNAIDLTHALGIKTPNAALLAAIETINDKIQSTVDAAALCKMAEREQITGALLEGPLAFDNAISAYAAKMKHIRSPIAGHADILLMPEFEAGNMLAKQLHYLGGANLAGLVVGARCPMVLTSRADEADARVISCALGSLYRAFLNSR